MFTCIHRLKDMDILDDMGVSKLSAKVFFFKVNASICCIAFNFFVEVHFNTY